ncbi:hypothetical protein [Nocardiopsis prasina]|uniref:hypothetical protein n=1 Tax=Nocardiopsis prasina TaxID=2015 RepID=UPI000349553C|nr:hypothetical protein [Nocardiopsis prasina]
MRGVVLDELREAVGTGAPRFDRRVRGAIARRDAVALGALHEEAHTGWRGRVPGAEERRSA